MNGVQQVARATAVNRAERRLDDIGVVMNAFATALVDDRKQAEESTANLLRLIDLHTARINEIAGLVMDVQLASEVLPRSYTLWRRLRWLVTGH